MGNTKLRRITEQENKWTDKACAKHKHDYCVDCLVRLSGSKRKHIGESYYRAVKCKHCNSFAYAVFMQRYSEIEEQARKLPVLEFNKLAFATGFKDISFVRVWEAGEFCVEEHGLVQIEEKER